MKNWAWLIPLVAACAADDPSTAEVEQNAGDYQAGDYQAGDYQAGDYQAGDYQAGDYQAGDYQGAHYASSTFAGATQNGAALTDISISGTTLTVWKKTKAPLYPFYGWEQRQPNRICTYLWDRTHPACTNVDPRTSASPLAGVRFKTTLNTPNGPITGWVQIGASSSALNAVKQDTSYAMWMLTNIYSGPSSTSQHAPVNCTNPAGCRQNSDLWTYDLELLNADGSQLGFCSSGQSYALEGTWNRVGAHDTSDDTVFTFACSTGTIAKCTRWGYRPWITSYTKSDGTHISFADYHQACVRAAMADYCANGHTATKYHTLVDIYDYDGFIPNMQALYPHATAFVWESEFDRLGATQLDFTRYYELAQSSSNGILAPDPIGCPMSLPILPSDPRDPIHKSYQRAYDTWTSPRVNVRSTPVCSHTEYTVGKFLHQNCSGCTMHLKADHPDPTTDYSYCTFPGDSRGWDAGCVWAASQYCGWNALNPNDWNTTMSKMAATHGECTTGTALLIYATACTADVCKDPGYESCCTSNWTSSCVVRANEQCRGGQEHNTLTHQYGFCDQVITLQNSL